MTAILKECQFDNFYFEKQKCFVVITVNSLTSRYFC